MFQENGWKIERRAADQYKDRQDSMFGATLRYSVFRVAVILMLIFCTCFHYLNDPLAWSKRPAYIPMVGITYSFIVRNYDFSNHPYLMGFRIFVIVSCGVASIIIAKKIIHKLILQVYLQLSMFSWRHKYFRSISPANDIYRSRLLDPDSRISIVSDDQGSWYVMMICGLFVMYLAAKFYRDIIIDTLYPNQDHLKIDYNIACTYQELQYALFKLMLFLISTTLVIVLDTMIQESRIWLSYYKTLRIPVFWVLVVLIVVGLYLTDLYSFLYHLVFGLDATLDAPSQFGFSTEADRAGISALTILLEIFILIQDSEFPTFAANENVNIPGWMSPVLSIRSIHFTSKWISYSFILIALPLDFVQMLNQLFYRPEFYGQYVDEIGQIYSITDAAYLKILETGFGVYDIRSNLSKVMESEPPPTRMPCYYVDYGFMGKVPAILIVLTALVLFIKIFCEEKDVMVYDKRMHGSKAEIYKAQLAKEGISDVVAKDLVKLNKMKQLYAYRKHIETSCFVLAMAGLLLMLAHNELIWTFYISHGKVNTETSNLTTIPGYFYSILIFCSTVFLLCLIIQRYRIQCEIFRLRNTIPPTSKWYNAPELRNLLLLELFLNALIVPPGVHGFFQVLEFRSTIPYPDATSTPTRCQEQLTHLPDGYYLSYSYPYEIFGMVMFVRLYWFSRLIRNYGGFQGQHSALIGRLNHVSTDSAGWNFRCLFHTSPLYVFAFMTMITWVFTAVAMMTFERTLSSELDGFTNSLWFALETMSTVGYGDCYPRTFGGRVCVVIGGVVGGTIVVSMLTTLFMDTIGTSEKEDAVLSSLNTQSWHQEISRASARLIQRAWRHSKLSREHRDLKKLDHSAQRLYQTIQQVKQLRYATPEREIDLQNELVEWHDTILTQKFETIHVNHKKRLRQMQHKIELLDTLCLQLEQAARKASDPIKL